MNGQNRLKSGPLAVFGCSERCNFNPTHWSEEAHKEIHKAFEDGKTIEQIREMAAVSLGRAPSVGSVSRHRQKHLHMIRPGEGPLPDEPVTDLEVLDNIIQRGAQQVKLAGTRVTTEQLLKAMELRLKLTQGSVFDHMFEAMRGAPVDLDEEFEDEESTRDTTPDKSADEQAQGALDE